MQKEPRLYSYIVKDDAGFAPNPFWGYCTLACCKPKIRKTASIGDWIVGLSPKSEGNKIIYAMQVEEILSFKEYYRDSRFSVKIPDRDLRKIKNSRGDNIYEHISNRKFRQLPSEHSNKKNREKENPKAKKHDLSGVNVLISKKFHYFGRKAIDLPEGLRSLKVGRGYKNKFSKAVFKKFLKFISKKQRGCCELPAKGDKADSASKTEKRCGLS
jgi:hypothetical protein